MNGTTAIKQKSMNIITGTGDGTDDTPSLNHVPPTYSHIMQAI